MKEKLVNVARRARESGAAAAQRTSEFVKEHAPSREQVDKAKQVAVETGQVVGDSALEAGKEVVRSKTFRNATIGAVIGAVVAMPVPFVGPLIGSILGAAIGALLGGKAGENSGPRVPAPPTDLYEELRKLDAAKREGLLTEAEFEKQKRKLLARS
jgi:hypothetical protein